MKPKISVIIPVYNVKNYVKKCIMSACKNTYENLEIVVVDDGSTDGSSEICDACAAEDARVQVVHKANGGTATARKMGLAVSSGEIVTFIDGDDWVEANMYESLADKMLEYECDVVATGMFREENGITYAEWRASNFSEGYYEGKDLLNLQKRFFQHGINQINGHCGNKLYRRYVVAPYIMEMGDQNTGIEDDNFSISALMAAKSIYLWNECFYHGVDRQGSVCHIRHLDWYYQMDLALKNYEAIIKRFPNEHVSYGIKQMFLYRLQIGIYHVFGDVHFPFYFWEDAGIYRGKKIILYGGGNVGEAFHQHILVDGNIDLVCWMDKQRQVSRLTQTPLVQPEGFEKYIFDFILVAVETKKVVEEIFGELEAQGIPRNRLIWSRPIPIVDFLMKVQHGGNQEAIKSLRDYFC